MHNQMILTPVAVDGHGRIGPMLRQNLCGTPPPPIPPQKQFKSNIPNAKAMYNRETTLPAPIGIFIEADQYNGNNSNLKTNSKNKNSMASALYHQHHQ
jgi:hypothetical protein